MIATFNPAELALMLLDISLTPHVSSWMTDFTISGKFAGAAKR